MSSTPKPACARRPPDMGQIFRTAARPEDLRALVGDPAQIAGIRRMRFDDGPETGSRLIQIRNAAGLCVELLPDRCLDIGQVWLAGIPLAWVGPNGLPPGSSGLTLDAALGGLMVTCGFDHVRQPETHDGRHYPLHGSMALRAARVIMAGSVGCGADAAFAVEAEVCQSSLMQPTFRLRRRITVPFAENRIAVDDHVSVSDAAPVFALYHVNLGFPLIGASTRVFCAGKDRPDLLAPEPQTRVEAAPADSYSIRVEAGCVALEMAIDGRQLPWLQTHRRAETGLNLFCIEPVTHDRKPRAALLGEATAAPVDRLDFGIRFTLEEGNGT